MPPIWRDCTVIGTNMRTQPPRGFGLGEEYGDPPHTCWCYWRIGDLRGRNIRVLWFLRLEKARGHGLCFFFIRPVFFIPLFLHIRSYDTTTGGILSLVFLFVPPCLLVPELLSSRYPTVFVLRLSSRKYLLVSGALLCLLEHILRRNSSSSRGCQASSCLLHCTTSHRCRLAPFSGLHVAEVRGIDCKDRSQT